MTRMKTQTMIALVSFLMAGSPGVSAQIPQQSIRWDKHSLIFDGKRVVPVMGEVHYSRIPQNEWREEVRKMKEGGVTVLAAYVFWNHVEEVEGVFNWSGQRNLRAFLEVCKQEQMPVVLRFGPFCHGEVRNGGIPDWMFAKGCKMREENPTFLKYTTELYRQIFSQVQGLQWKDGGPVIAAQFDNEYRGKGSYLMALKKIAQQIGFDLPFYTRTGWPELRTPVPFGEMIPLYGDYADGFWERSLKEAAGNYYKAFNFKAFRSSTAIATEQLGKQEEKINQGDGAYPYFTCELGGGMMTSYHRRPYIYPEDAYSLAIVKLGSGSNLLGYYMYHGGTNPTAMQPGNLDDGSAMYLNENQRTQATNYNDMPVKTYDFQAPLGEFGQKNPHYFMLRKLHLFMHDYAEVLAPMEATFPCRQDIEKGDDSHLRWSLRSMLVSSSDAFDGTSGKKGASDEKGFVFINNYERLRQLSAKKNVQFDVCGVKFPQRPMTIPAGAMCIFPVNIDGIKYATAQLVAKRDGKIYLEQVAGIPTEICFVNRDGKTVKFMKNAKVKGINKPIYKNVYLVDSKTAEHLFLQDEGFSLDANYAKNGHVAEMKIVSKQGWAPSFKKVKEADGARHITIGVQKVTEEPSDADFKKAAVYEISLSPEMQEGKNILQINYRGDCARLYADGKLVADNFYNGRPFLMGLWRLPKKCQKLELRILPLQKGMPVYFPREANVTKEGEEVFKMNVVSESDKYETNGEKR